MNETLVAPAIEAPTEAETAFEALYRSSRDDLFAYVAGLRDHHRRAAGDRVADQRTRATADAQQAELNGVERRDGLRPGSVDVTSSGSSSDQDGDWSLGEALEHAPGTRGDRRHRARQPRGYSSTGSKSALRAPQTGQNQVSGISLKSVPGDAAVRIALVGVVDEPA